MRIRAAFALALAALLPGCATLEYYWQAIGGQLEVIGRAQSIAERLRDPSLPPSLREKFQRVLAIREFASAELALPDNGSYRRYADLDRQFVVWNVFAAPEFSVKPIESCFPFAGCVGYRGFYRESDARAHAQSLRDKGYDVHVAGVPAYSTLGWFDDPVLNTFIRYPDAEIARLVFHELAHQVAYARDDTVFNESFAVTVEQEGVRRWLDRRGTQAERDAYAIHQSRRRDFVALILRYRDRLSAFYAEPLDVQRMREGKARLFAEMLGDYARLKAKWGGFAGYDRFFAQGPNNALLASVVAYTERVPAFRALLAQKGGDLAAFYAEVKRLARERRPERNQFLDRVHAGTSSP